MRSDLCLNKERTKRRRGVCLRRRRRLLSSAHLKANDRWSVCEPKPPLQPLGGLFCCRWPRSHLRLEKNLDASKPSEHPYPKNSSWDLTGFSWDLTGFFVFSSPACVCRCDAFIRGILSRPSSLFYSSNNNKPIIKGSVSPFISPRLTLRPIVIGKRRTKIYSTEMCSFLCFRPIALGP